MDLDRIRAMIDAAVHDEQEHHRVRDLLTQVAGGNQRQLGGQDLERGVRFVEDYVRAVPRIISEAIGRASGTHAEAKMVRMMAAASAYWIMEEDLIPDHLGLLGLLDDAWATLRLLELLSLRFAEETGSPLVSEDLASPNRDVAALLGPDVHERLGEYVEEALHDASIDDLMGSLARAPLPPPPTAGSSWPQDDFMADLLGL